MNRQDAERVLTEYLNPIFGFALKRCKSIQDAEDLSQEIALKAFRALTVKEDIADVGKFIWTVAHNALSNYYRDTAKSIVGVSVDEAAYLTAESDFEAGDGRDEALRRLCSEIAYLSKTQRRIVIAYYFENKKQADISRELGIPLGTIKWHLFEAKKELKRGMYAMRKASELKFNPVKFESYGLVGSAGLKQIGEFLRSPLSQNICYCVRDEAKTVGEIADDLGVSPVYVESEAEFLEEYGLLKMQKGRYISNFIITEPTNELLAIQNKVYRRAAELFANDLYDALAADGILRDTGIECAQSDGDVSLTEDARADDNFILWSLIPYIAAFSGEKLMKETVSFEEAATIRPDGAYNIVNASVAPCDLVLPDGYVNMENWFGPMWQGGKTHILWQADSDWSEKRAAANLANPKEADRVISLFERERESEECLSKDEYAWLCERGYVKTNGGRDGNFKSAWQVVVLANREIRDRLIAVGDRIKEKYKDEFDALKESYVKAVLKEVPEHVRKMQEYELQFVFHADGCFLCHCMNALLESGKLKEPTENQRKALMTVIAPSF